MKSQHAEERVPELQFSRNALKIKKIETFGVRVPLNRRYSGSHYSMTNRCTIITRITTDDGIASEVYNGDADDEQEALLRIIHEELAPLLLGKSATDPEGCWLAMLPATYDILRPRVHALQAIACLDTAIWDVFAKGLGVSISRAWGSTRDAVPISIIGGYYHLDSGAIRESVLEYVAEGFAGCKFKVGGAQPERDAERVQIAREACGPDFAVMVDANQGYSHQEAVSFARRTADLGLRWFEEPCRWNNDRNWMRDVRLQTGLPIAAGQSEVTLSGLRDLMAAGAIDISNFDASWSGGPTLWRKSAGLAAAYGIELGHHEEPQLAGHLLAAVPNSTFVECFDRERDPFFWNAQGRSPRIHERCLVLPEAPGFGIELDWDYVGKYTVAKQVSS
jgi:D-galactarolactone cycloisomerase